MPRITQKSLEANWIRIHQNTILNWIRERDEDDFDRVYTKAIGDKPTLSTVLAKVYGERVPDAEIRSDHDDEFIRFLIVLNKLDNQHRVKADILKLLKGPGYKLPEEPKLTPALKSSFPNLHRSAGVTFDDVEEDEEDEEDEEVVLVPRPPVAPKGPYMQGFAFAAQKREAAKKNRLKWFLDHQLTQMKELANLAWWAKIRAVMYGLAIGIAMAGFMLMFFHAHLSAAAMAVVGLTLVPFLSYFPAMQNFWITRRDPSKLSFDLFSPHEPVETKRLVNDGWSDTTYKVLNTPVWGYTVKELLARVGGFLNATVYGGLTLTGMLELFKEFGLNSLYSSYALTLGSLTIPYSAIVCGVIAIAMSRMVFKPELGLGVKFIRDWLNKNPVQVFLDMNGRVNPEGHLTNKYFLRFAALFSCIVIGGVFTTLAAADLVGSLTGGPGWIIKLSLSFLTISVVPFYYGKAIDNVWKVWKADNPNSTEAKQDAASSDQSAKRPKSTWEKVHEWFVRRLNALVHSVPAFLGGLATFAGIGGVFFGLFTGSAGFGASYISGENGEEEGYEKEIQKEIDETRLALQDLSNKECVTEEPWIEVDGQGLQLATKQPYLLSFFNMSKDTEESALDLLEGRVLAPESTPKQKVL